MKKVLVTGADGFIGSHLTEELIKRGYDVRAFVLYNSFNSWGWLDTIPKGIKSNLDVFSGDIRDLHSVKKAMSGCDSVFHLAALISIPYSYVSLDSYVDTNMKGTLNILQAANELGVEKVVHTSTSEVYGSAEFVPITEKHPLNGQSPYSATKIGADQLAMSFYNSFNTPITILRPFNTYGPRQSARAIIPTIITQLSADKQILDLGSLYPTRDFSYVLDTVNGFITVYESDKTVGEVINCGSDYEISIGDLAKKIANIVGIKIDIRTDDIRIRPKKSEVQRLWSDNKKLLQLTKFKPSISLDDGLKRTIDWFSYDENIKHYKSHIYNV